MSEPILKLGIPAGSLQEATGELFRKAGGEVAGCAFLVELGFLGGREKLKPVEVFSLIQY